GAESEVPESGDDYPAIGARWLAEAPERLERFFAFMDLFAHREPEPALVSALHLFELSEGDPSVLAGERLAAALAFAERHATPAGRALLVDSLGRAAGHAVGVLSPADCMSLIRFLAEAARETARAEHRALALGVWLSLVTEWVLRRGE